ncbi:hemolysin family protein [Spelaeicoccus albus]|uniref:CBS domain containing-hemolysin-like protein n=1 Tax=Spelaeicoccus albus TaxID=1280376 RepID=A0A7Z0D3C5_9MICO|nr:hemolysin family protein [Spelaeicoccus albus]NYI68128.1 CBS domain containing-hemolysin-like protein [Spelaeicoccus albus]
MEWILLALAIVLTAGTGLFVIAEFSLITLDRPMVEDAVKRGEAGSKQLLRGVRTLSTQLSSAQVGITLTTLLTGFLMEPSLGRLLAGPLEDLGVPGSKSVALTIALIAATVFSMLIGELVPKNLAITSPLAAGRRVAAFQLSFTLVFKPLVALLNGTANLVLHWMGLSPQEENSSGRAPQELVALVRRSAEAGTLDAQTATLLTRSLAFSERTAADVMTPRTQVYSVRKSTTAAELVTIARRTGFSRFPVVGSSRDDIIGVVHLKTAIAVPHENRHQAFVGSLMREAVQLPETVRLDPLLLELRGKGLQMAVVVDEFGGTAGVVTLEDVVEELVGEVADEHDRSRSGARRTVDGSWMMPGLLRPDEARRETGAAIPEDSAYETLGGYLMTELGRVPEVGDRIAIPAGILRVERMHRRRVDRVRFIPSLGAAAKQGGADESASSDRRRNKAGGHTDA